MTPGRLLKAVAKLAEKIVIKPANIELERAEIQLAAIEKSFNKLVDDRKDLETYIAKVSQQIPGTGLLAVKVDRLLKDYNERCKFLGGLFTPWVVADKVAEAGEWWYWNGDKDHAAVPVTIMRDSGGAFFACAGQLGWTYSQMVLDLGGWWKKIPYPELPDVD